MAFDPGSPATVASSGSARWTSSGSARWTRSGTKRKRPPRCVVNSRCSSVNGADVRHRLHRGASVLGTLLVEASRQRTETLLAKDVAHSRRGHLLPALGESPADVMHRVVLLAQGDHDFWLAFSSAWGLDDGARGCAARLIVGINLN